MQQLGVAVCHALDGLVQAAAGTLDDVGGKGPGAAHKTCNSCVKEWETRLGLAARQAV